MSTAAITTGDVTSVQTQIEEIAAEWDDLVTRCEAPLFVRPGWLRAWLDAFGRRALAIYTVRRDGRLVALVPLLRGRFGSLASPTNDHTPLWAPLAQDGAAAEALARAVLAHRPARLRLGILELDCVATRHFVATLERAGYRSVVHHREWSPYVDATVAPDVFSKRFSTKQRRSMRRRARRLDDLGEVTFGTCRGGDRLGDVLDEGLAVEASEWKGRRGTAIACDPATLTFYRHVARWAGENGWLLLTMLRVDRRMVAFSFGFDHHDVVYGLKIGYDERHAKLSPGLQLIHRILNLALAGRTRTVDMLGADDPYKRTVADGTRERITADWFAPTWSSRAAMVTTTAWVRWRRRAHRVLQTCSPRHSWSSCGRRRRTRGS